MFQLEYWAIIFSAQRFVSKSSIVGKRTESHSDFVTSAKHFLKMSCPRLVRISPPSDFRYIRITAAFSTALSPFRQISVIDAGEALFSCLVCESDLISVRFIPAPLW